MTVPLQSPPTPPIAFTGSLGENIVLLLGTLGYEPLQGPIERVVISHGDGDDIRVVGTDNGRATFLALIHYLTCREIGLALTDVDRLQQEWMDKGIRLGSATRVELTKFLADQWPAHDPAHWIICWLFAHWDQKALVVKITRLRPQLH